MEKNNKSPLFIILKRDNMPKKKSILYRVLIVLASFVFSILLTSIFTKADPFTLSGLMFVGAFNNPWKFVFDAVILLGFGVAIVPAFKMKYWNMGANGQVLVGCLAACVCMFYLSIYTELPSIVIMLIMFVSSLIASTIWAVIPAIFKALFNTNETLFTLMTNYIAGALVGYINFIMAGGNQDNPGIINLLTEKGWMPLVLDEYFIPIIIIIIISAFVYFYINKSVHGFEISVLGDSRNTAKYANMNVKLITIRTLVVSGIICGIIGFLYASAIDHSVSASTGGSLGFTGVLVAWLSNFNPIIMLGVSAILSFITNGSSKISSTYHLSANNLSSVITGIVFFSLLIAEFIIRYRVLFRKRNKVKRVEVSVNEEAK